MRRTAWLWPLLCPLLGVLPCLASPAHAQWTGAPGAEGADLRIVDVVLRQRDTIATEMLAWQAPDGALYLPLADLMDVVDFRVTVDAAGADGWFIREAQRFRIDRAAGFVQIGGRRQELNPGDIAEIDGVAHVSIGALNRWLALGIDWIPDRQVVSLTPPYLLAAEETARRGGGAARAGMADDDHADLPRQSSAPDWISWPYVTANLALVAQSGGRAGAGTDFAGQASVFALGDLLGTSAQLALTATRPGRADARLTLTRQDPEARLLGPLGASIVQGGDVNVQSVPLLLRNGNGLGVRIGRGQLNAAGRFDQIDLVGDAPPGWQAELYRDNQLLDFQTITSDGRYLFPAVPLLFGGNRFRIQLYGPSGERQTILRNHDIATDLIPPGAITYSLAALKQGRSLFRRSFYDVDPLSAGIDDPANPASLFNPTGLHAHAQIGYGLTRTLSMTAILARREEEFGIDATYAGAGFGWRLGGGMLVSGDLLHQSGGGVAGRVSVLGGIGGISLSLQHERYAGGFLSDENRVAAGVVMRSRETLSLDGQLAGMGWNLSAAQNARSDGASDRYASLRTSILAGAMSITPRVSYRDVTLGDAGRDRRLDAGFAAAGAIGQWRLRALLDLDITPQTRLRSAGGEVSLRLSEWFLAGSVDRDFLQPTTRYSLSANRDWNGLRLGAEARYDEGSRGFSGLLTLSFAIDRAPLGKGFRLGRDARGHGGTVIARVFEDRDGDGRFGTGDELLPDAEVISAPRATSQRQDGVTLLETLPVDRMVAIMPDLSGVADPDLAPATPGRRVLTRAGGVTKVDLAVVATGEVELLLLDSAGEEVAARVLTLTRCDDPAVQRRVRTAFDGRAIAQGILPGCHAIGSEGEQLGTVTVMARELVRQTLRLARTEPDVAP